MEAKQRKVEVYQRPDGTKPFLDWMRSQDKPAISEIIARLNKVRRGALGDYDNVGDGIIELRFLGPGPGYRIYCADDGRSLVLLLCGGIKRTQTADIGYAKELWNEYNEGKKPKKEPADQHGSIRRRTKN